MEQTDLIEQVDRGQAALGRLMRQFLNVNDFKHVQFMQMAHSITGERWLHSSQISTLKRGATKNLTGFPLYSVAAVNRRIWEIGQGIATRPPGTRLEDWEDKLPMLREDGSPLDVGDLWRIYFGELAPPTFGGKAIIEIDDAMAKTISQRIHEICTEAADKDSQNLLSFMPKVLTGFGPATSDEVRLLKGVVLGVVNLDAEQISEISAKLGNMLSVILEREFSEQNVYELALPDT